MRYEPICPRWRCQVFVEINSATHELAHGCGYEVLFEMVMLRVSLPSLNNFHLFTVWFEAGRGLTKVCGNLILQGYSFTNTLVRLKTLAGS